MLRKFVATLLALVIVSAGQTSLVAPASAATFELSPTDTIRITSSKGTKICTIGAFGETPDDTNYILTAGHCADFSDSPVSDARGVRIGRVVASRGTDVNQRHVGYTLIRLNSGGRIHAGFVSIRNPRVGDRVHFAGYATASATAYVTSLDAANYFNFNIDPDHGDSGGPLWVDAYNGSVLVGFVLSSTRGYEQGQGVPVGYFLDYARRDAPGLKILVK